MREGAAFPPVTAFGTEEEAYLADGSHGSVAEPEVDRVLATCPAICTGSPRDQYIPGRPKRDESQLQPH